MIIAKSAAEARTLGLPVYNTGKPCKHGHVAERSTTNKSCRICQLIRLKSWNEGRDPEEREASIKIWHDNNKPRHSKTGKLWYENNKQRRYTATMAWRRANPDRWNCIARNYRARKVASSGNHTVEDVLSLLKKQQNKCAGPTCNIDLIKYHIDHKTPLSRGGSNWPRNLQLLCPSCNTSKCDQTQREWHRSLGYG